jgi:hypothetical protein
MRRKRYLVGVVGKMNILVIFISAIQRSPQKKKRKKKKIPAPPLSHAIGRGRLIRKSSGLKFCLS